MSVDYDRVTGPDGDLFVRESKVAREKLEQQEEEKQLAQKRRWGMAFVVVGVFVVGVFTGWNEHAYKHPEPEPVPKSVAMCDSATEDLAYAYFSEVRDDQPLDDPSLARSVIRYAACRGF